MHESQGELCRGGHVNSSLMFADGAVRWMMQISAQEASVCQPG